MKLELLVSLLVSTLSMKSMEGISSRLTFSFLFSVQRIFTLIEFLTHFFVRQNFFGSY